MFNLLKRNRRTTSEYIFDNLNLFIMLVICFLTLYPIWYVIVNSLNEGMDAMKGGIYWWPREFTLSNYKAVFANQGILTSFGVTIAKTVIGTLTHVLFTAMVAYALSRRELRGRNIYMFVGIVTMFFSGGLIPYFLLLRDIGLLDNFLVYIVPALFNFFHLIIFVSFFREIPTSLEEAAKMDGASDIKIFLKVIIPLSMPVIATIALFQGVYQWNDYFAGIIFVNDPELQPIQTYLYKVVAESSSNQMMVNAPGGVANKSVTSQSIKLATMVVTTLPIVLVYPFLQKYFVKGMLIGSVKG
ncbi:carbohydrate ABC transporter permease [Lederbergia lenta]|uniref:Binding-protein-dependent transporters inner membrane component n=1 Tax=Lederbergia lenta TaxID=1467 RepID=A0A2X4WDR2_LEDLE|nr:carbohydrate ABC transporter permease [Lederbergia lenta]MCM3111995.1 carbohydrate ABC transporter permease [Lederbergia lenta]MEC2323167.1 carbohydrate ABC transporter permease [Lederbergia lenta]SQI62877.1 binding-protein-dependent transporters inner membrane component [Lederbergia lenta]